MGNVCWELYCLDGECMAIPFKYTVEKGKVTGKDLVFLWREDFPTFVHFLNF